MYKEYWKTAAWVGAAGLAVLAVITLVIGRWVAVIIPAGFLGVGLVLLIGKRRIPPMFTFLFVLTGLLDGAGYVWKLFEKPGVYDELAHLFTSFVVALTLAYAAYASVRLEFKKHLLLFAILVTTFGISAGVVWEWFEWLAGIVGDLGDTLMDLVMDTLGACLAGLLAAWALHREPTDDTPEPA